MNPGASTRAMHGCWGLPSYLVASLAPDPFLMAPPPLSVSKIPGPHFPRFSKWNLVFPRHLVHLPGYQCAVSSERLTFPSSGVFSISPPCRAWTRLIVGCTPGPLEWLERLECWNGPPSPPTAPRGLPIGSHQGPSDQANAQSASWSAVDCYTSTSGLAAWARWGPVLWPTQAQDGSYTGTWLLDRLTV